MLVLAFKMEEKLIGYKPNSFQVRELILTRNQDGLNAVPVGEEITFNEMRKRRTSINPDEAWKNVNNSGYKVANLGVGAIITTKINGLDFLVGLNHYRGESNDFVFNHIGGYLESKDYGNPFHAIEAEIAEEFLPITGDGKLIRFSIDGKPIERPFAENFQDCKAMFNLETGKSKFSYPYLIKPVFFEGKPVVVYNLLSDLDGLVANAIKKFGLGSDYS